MSFVAAILRKRQTGGYKNFLKVLDKQKTMHYIKIKNMFFEYEKNKKIINLKLKAKKYTPSTACVYRGEGYYNNQLMYI